MVPSSQVQYFAASGGGISEVMGEASKANQESNLGTNRDPLGELGTGSGVSGAPRASAGTESPQWAGGSFSQGPALGGLHIHRAKGLHVMKAKHAREFT